MAFPVCPLGKHGPALTTLASGLGQGSEGRLDASHLVLAEFKAVVQPHDLQLGPQIDV